MLRFMFCFSFCFWKVSSIVVLLFIFLKICFISSLFNYYLQEFWSLNPFKFFSRSFHFFFFFNIFLSHSFSRLFFLLSSKSFIKFSYELNPLRDLKNLFFISESLGFSNISLISVSFLHESLFFGHFLVLVFEFFIQHIFYILNAYLNMNTFNFVWSVDLHFLLVHCCFSVGIASQLTYLEFFFPRFSTIAMWGFYFPLNWFSLNEVCHKIISWMVPSSVRIAKSCYFSIFFFFKFVIGNVKGCENTKLIVYFCLSAP